MYTSYSLVVGSDGEGYFFGNTENFTVHGYHSPIDVRVVGAQRLRIKQLICVVIQNAMVMEELQTICFCPDRCSFCVCPKNMFVIVSRRALISSASMYSFLLR